MPDHYVTEVDPREDPRRGIELHDRPEVERELRPIFRREGRWQEERAHIALASKSLPDEPREPRTRLGEHADSIPAVARFDPEKALGPVPLVHESARQGGPRGAGEVVLGKEADLGVESPPSRDVESEAPADACVGRIAVAQAQHRGLDRDVAPASPRLRQRGSRADEADDEQC